MESGKIIVVANQKGGVAKTSTVRNLSYALAEMGKKVLVVDFDPQYNLTTSFGVLPTQAPYNTGTLITNLLLDESLPDTNEFIQKNRSDDIFQPIFTVAEATLLMTPDSTDYLAALLNPLRLSYDYIIVDTNPSLGSLTINALTAADEVIIPIDPELFALTGLQALVDTIKKIKRKLNPSIEIGGILFTKCNKRTNLYRRTYGQVTKAFQSLPIFNCQIPYTVKVGDANSYGMSVMELEQANPASLAYLELAKEVLANA
ncbi:MAG: ParA family protein [Acutalibacteraceae bacterium]